MSERGDSMETAERTRVDPTRSGTRSGEVALSVRATRATEGEERRREVVFDVRDSFCSWNEGRWRLADGRAERTDAPPDLRLDVRELGSAYLGGIGFVQLAQSGLVEEVTQGALARADRMFWSPLQPWCPEIF